VDLTKFLENQHFRFDYAFDETCSNELVYKWVQLLCYELEGEVERVKYCVCKLWICVCEWERERERERERARARERQTYKDTWKTMLMWLHLHNLSLRETQHFLKSDVIILKYCYFDFKQMLCLSWVVMSLYLLHHLWDTLCCAGTQELHQLKPLLNVTDKGTSQLVWISWIFNSYTKNECQIQWQRLALSMRFPILCLLIPKSGGGGQFLKCCIFYIKCRHWIM
jgi:hypothetical protein